MDVKVEVEVATKEEVVAVVSAYHGPYPFRSLY